MRFATLLVKAVLAGTAELQHFPKPASIDFLSSFMLRHFKCAQCWCARITKTAMQALHMQASVCSCGSKHQICALDMCISSVLSQPTWV